MVLFYFTLQCIWTRKESGVINDSNTTSANCKYLFQYDDNMSNKPYHYEMQLTKKTQAKTHLLIGLSLMRRFLTLGCGTLSPIPYSFLYRRSVDVEGVDIVAFSATDLPRRSAHSIIARLKISPESLLLILLFALRTLSSTAASLLSNDCTRHYGMPWTNDTIVVSKEKTILEIVSEFARFPTWCPGWSKQDRHHEIPRSLHKPTSWTRVGSCLANCLDRWRMRLILLVSVGLRGF